MSVADEPFAQDGAGEPDGLQRLWMPHRMAYIKGENRAADGPEECPFCRAPTLADADGLIVARGELVYTVMNLYPYNSGHVMVCPYRHVADYTDLDLPETAELAAHTKQAMQALRTASGAQGFNIGMNMGGVSDDKTDRGAGLAGERRLAPVSPWRRSPACRPGATGAARSAGRTG